MSATSVVAILENLENQQFNWLPAGSGGIWAYLVGNPGHSTLRGLNGAMPNWKTSGLACFMLPIVVALKNLDITQTEAEDLVGDVVHASGGGGLSVRWAPAGVRRYFFGNLSFVRDAQGSFGSPVSPNRGDVVYFSGAGCDYFAHVCVATGQGSETISFGHDAPASAFSTPLLVGRRSIEQITAANPRITMCHFGPPSW